MTIKAAKGAKRKADLLASKIVRSRGHCENCQSTRDLQCAHIISRRYANTRTDLDNLLCLCATCHFRFTDWPLEFADFVEDRIGIALYNSLVAKAGLIAKMDWPAEVERLTWLLKQADGYIARDASA